MLRSDQTNRTAGVQCLKVEERDPALSGLTQVAGFTPCFSTGVRIICCFTCLLQVVQNCKVIFVLLNLSVFFKLQPFKMPKFKQ